MKTALWWKLGLVAVLCTPPFFSARAQEGKACAVKLDYQYFCSLDDDGKLSFADQHYASFPKEEREMMVADLGLLRSSEVDLLFAAWRRTERSPKIKGLLRSLRSRRQNICRYRSGDLVFEPSPTELDRSAFSRLSWELKLESIVQNFRGWSPEDRVWVLQALREVRGGEELEALFADIARDEKSIEVQRALREVGQWRRRNLPRFSFSVSG